MSARNPVHYTRAERESYKLVPPTCDAIDAVCQELRNFFDPEIARAALLGNRMEPTPQLMAAVHEAVTRQLWPALTELADAAKFHGTYPLRRALIKEIEQRTPGPHAPNHYDDWIEDGLSSLERRARRRKDHSPHSTMRTDNDTGA